MLFPDTVLTKSKTGKIEVRTLDSKGKYVMCEFQDAATLKPADQKRKLTLVDDSGRVQEFFFMSFRLKDRTGHCLLWLKKKRKTGRCGMSLHSAKKNSRNVSFKQKKAKKQRVRFVV